MSEEAGKGFARQVTDLNLAKFAPLLRDRTKEPTPPLSEENVPPKTTPGSGTDELSAAQSLFAGSRVRVRLPFTFSWGTPGQATEAGTPMVEPGPTEGEASDDSGVSYSVLVAEIPGPGRWKQASFSREVFVEFFGAGIIEFTYIDPHGTLVHDTANPIVKSSRNYCYELGAAAGLAYPNVGIGRPIGVFLRLEPQQFQYCLVMPSDPGHTILVTFLANNWVGSARLMRRVNTDLDALISIWPSAPLPLIVSGVAGG